MTDEHAAGDEAPQLGRQVDAGLGDETRELLLRGELDEALRRHDGSRKRAAEAADDQQGGGTG